MRCEEFEIRLNDCLDQRRHPRFDALLSRHARLCCKCRSLVCVYGIIMEELGPDQVSSVTMVPLELKLGELKLASDKRAALAIGRASPMPPWGAPTLWTAAGILLMIAFAWRAGPDHLPATPAVVARTPLSHALPGESGNAQSYGAVNGIVPWAQQARAEYALLSRDTSGAFSHVGLLMPAVSDLAASSVITKVALAAEADRNGLAELAAGFKPLAESTAGAVNFFLQVLPLEADFAAPPEQALPTAEQRGSSTG